MPGKNRCSSLQHSAGVKTLPSKQGSVCKRSCSPVLVVDDVVDLHKVVNVADVARVLGKVVRVRPPVHGVEHEEREEEDVDHEGAALGGRLAARV